MMRRLAATVAGAITVVMMCSGASSDTPAVVAAATPYLRTTTQSQKASAAMYEYLTEQTMVGNYITAVQQQEVADYLVSVAHDEYVASLPPGLGMPAGTGSLVVDVAHWTAINLCEEGGTWINDGWTSDGHFQGGLGMSVEAWNGVVNEAPSYGISLPPSSNQATPYQQMQGAQILFNRAGASPWACKG